MMGKIKLKVIPQTSNDLVWNRSVLILKQLHFHRSRAFHDQKEVMEV